MRTLIALVLLFTIPAAASAQCEIERFLPGTGNTYVEATGGLAGDLAAFAYDFDQVAVYQGSASGWSKIKDFGADGNSWIMGITLELSEDLLVTGAPDSANAEGRVYVYERSDNYQTGTELQASTPQSLDTFGAAMAVHGDTLVVGASMMVTDVLCGPGHSFIFERSGGVWQEVAEFAPHDQVNAMGGYGVEIDTDGQTAVIGAETDDSLPVADSYLWGHGAAYVYERAPDGTWFESAKLFASPPVFGEEFGSSVAVDGDVLFVGASGAHGGGAVYEFRRTPAGWVESQVLRPGDGVQGDQFGTSIALSGNRLVVGAPGVDGASSSAGAIYGFERVGTTWVETVKIEADGEPVNALFGSHVALEGNQALWFGWWSQNGVRLSSLGVDQSVAFCTSAINSTGAAAVLSAEGCDSVLGNGLVLTTTDLPANQVGMVFFSQNTQQVPFGNGFLCLAAPILRLPVGLSNSAGVLTTAVDFQSVPASVMTAGSTWSFQTYHRDLGFGAGFGAANALELTLQP